jgi:hypothetical protein
MPSPLSSSCHHKANQPDSHSDKENSNQRRSVVLSPATVDGSRSWRRLSVEAIKPPLELQIRSAHRVDHLLCPFKALLLLRLRAGLESDFKFSADHKSTREHSWNPRATRWFTVKNTFFTVQDLDSQWILWDDTCWPHVTVRSRSVRRCCSVFSCDG